MTCNNSNLKLPFLAIRCLKWGLHLPVDLPIWPVTIAIWNCHSWQIGAYARGVNLSVNLPIWPVTIEFWNFHSWPLDGSTGGGTSVSWSAYMTCNIRNLKLPFLATRCLYWRGIDLPVDLPISPVIIAIWNCQCWPLDTSIWGGGRSASWSAYMTCKNSNLKLPLLATRCLYLGWGYICQLICLYDLSQ